MKHTRLEAIEKSDADRFLVLYKAQIYKDDNFATKNDLMTYEQLETESLSDYEYRLREKANLAYSDTKVAEENALFCFSPRCSGRDAEAQTQRISNKITRRCGQNCETNQQSKQTLQSSS